MNAKTVTFDVGGSIYRVSRSLIEQYPDTMLARLISDTWAPGQNHPAKSGAGDDNGKTSDEEKADANETNDPKKKREKPLFIERDGKRFRYCLDYMRNGGNVVLPPAIPKDALLQDLVYYGFQDLDPSTITVVGSFPMFKTCFDHIDSHLKTLSSEISDLEMKQRCLKLAEHCLRHYKNRASLSYIPVEYSEEDESKIPLYHAARNVKVDSESYKQVFSETLERFGLKLKRCEGTGFRGHSVCLEYL